MLLARMMAKPFVPVVNLIVVASIGYLVWNFVADVAIFAWAGVVAVSEVVRLRHARRVLARPPADPAPALRRMEWIALFVGAARGSAMPLFFASLPPLAHAALTVVFLGFCAGGLSTHGAYARAFYLFAVPMLAASAVAWLATGTAAGVVLGLLFVAFALMILVSARQLEQLVRDSFFIRQQRDQLVAQLDEERQRVALARDHAERANDAKSRFLAAASHDLRQPLHALSLFSAALNVRAADPDVREIAGHIGKGLQSLSSLVDALLDVSKLDAKAVTLELRPVDAVTLAERVVAEYTPAAKRKGLALRIMPSAAVVRTDPVLLSQLLRNLVDNAVKYTATGSIGVEMRREGPLVRIIVRDTGEGIPAAERERIFEEFYQIGNPERDRTRGLGLGLAIVRRIAHLLGTEVALESEVGRGSAFSVTVPWTPELPSPVEEASAASAADAALRERHVLVVDDEADVRVATRRLLETWGCTVLVSSGLEDATRLLDEHAPPLDVILADLRLRGGENGIATVEALRRRVGPVPAVLVTGDTAPERLQEAKRSGLPMLHKPVAAEDLRRTLIACMRPRGVSST